MKAKNIIILHGWGLNGVKYEDLKANFKSLGYKVYNPDLPGFGSNKLSKEEFTMQDYAQYLKDYLINNKISDTLLIGHSFGGRVIVAFIHEYKSILDNFNIKAVVLTGSPLIRSTLSLRKLIGILISKTGKYTNKFLNINDNQSLRKLIYKITGEWDYYKSGNMKKTFTNIINYDLESKLNEIKIPTLIIWGRDDKITSVSIAWKINQYIKNSKLVIIDHSTHRLPYENSSVFAKEVNKFLSTL